MSIHPTKDHVVGSQPAAQPLIFTSQDSLPFSQVENPISCGDEEVEMLASVLINNKGHRSHLLLRQY